jgi:hypothetical protein
MVRGRNTKVIGVRVSDDLYQRIEDDVDSLLKPLSMSDWLKEAIEEKLAAAQEKSPRMRDSIKQKSKSQAVHANRPSPQQSTPAPAEVSDEVSPGNRFPGTPRGAPCPCGSGEKYKRCCGREAPSAKKRRK